MSKIDTQKWKKLYIKDVFITNFKNKAGTELQVPTGANVPSKLLEEGDTPRITVTGLNNGISGYYQDRTDDSNYRVYENFISVSFLGTVFYQPFRASLDMKVHCLKPLTHVLNKYTGQFLVAAICAGIRESSYADQISSTVLPELSIYLPVDSTEQPDWLFMEEYMKMYEDKVAERVSNLQKISTNGNKTDISNWKEFHLGDVFNIKSGSGSDTGKMTDDNPTVALISRKGFNNGFVSMVDEQPNNKPFEKGQLSLALGGAYLGACFVQPCQFYTGEHMVVLDPKVEMSFYCKQYIATVITKSARLKYRAFVDEMDSHIKTDYTIKLPITSTGELDLNYMENYMIKICEKAKKNITTLCNH